MSDLVTVHIDQHVADVRFNRPDKMNALNASLLEAITETGKQLASDKSVRAVVLSGEGRSFCAGLDIESFGANSDLFEVFKAGSDEYPNFFQQPAFVWKSIPVPVICALHGASFGGGLQIALGADIRIADPGTQLSLMEIKWGLIPDMSASQTLRDLVRLDIAKELMYTGRIVSADEALNLGLVTSLSEAPREAALDLAHTIANKNPDAICYGKYLFDNYWHGEYEKGLHAEERLQAKVIMSHNQLEAVMAAMEKREPKFQSRTIGNFKDIKL